MMVYLKTINGAEDGAYYVYEDDYKIMCSHDSWKVRVYCIDYGLAFIMEQDAYKMTPTHTSSNTVMFYNHSGLGTGSTRAVFTYTHFRYVGRLSRLSKTSNEMEFKNLGEMIDVMCAKHRMLK